MNFFKLIYLKHRISKKTFSFNYKKKTQLLEGKIIFDIKKVRQGETGGHAILGSANKCFHKYT